jgi:hypothetical protein
MLRGLRRWVGQLRDDVRARQEARRQLRATARYDAGYRTGMAILASREMTPESLYQCTEEAKDFNDFDDFDVGIRSAIFDFEQSGVDVLAPQAGRRGG